MPPLTLAEVDSFRRTPGRSLLLYLTDRCPVGCDHCSVDSRPDSPRISDWETLEAMVHGIAALDDLRLVGISGGEPFVERHGLGFATSALAGAHKQLALYTSGVWARRAVPRWVPPILSRAACVFLSTDSFHADAIDDDTFTRAATAVVEGGAQLIVQVLDEPATVDRVDSLLALAFGDPRPDRVETKVIPLLAQGRGAVLVPAPGRRKLDGFGPCNLLTSPIVRYDGTVVACCNEQVLTGHGPDRLRHPCHTSGGVAAGIAAFADDPLLRAMARSGTRAVAHHPRFGEVPTTARGICDACWHLQSEAGPLGTSDPLLEALALVGEGPR